LEVDIAALQAKIVKLMNENHVLMHEKQKITTEWEEMRALYENTDIAKRRLEKKYIATEETFNEMKNAFEETKKVCELKEEELSDAKDEIEVQQNTIEALKAQCDHLEKQRKLIAEREHEIQVQIEKELCKKYEEQIQLKDGKYTQLSAVHNEEIQKYQNECQILKDKIKCLVNDLDATQEMKQKMNLEMTELIPKIMMLEKMKSRNDEKIKKLECSLMEVQQECKETSEKHLVAEAKVKESHTILIMKESLLQHYKKQINDMTQSHQVKEFTEHEKYIKEKEEMKQTFTEQKLHFEEEFALLRKESNEEFVRLRSLLSVRESQIKSQLAYLDELMIKIRELEATNEVKRQQWLEEKSGLECAIEQYRQKILEQTHATMTSSCNMTVEEDNMNVTPGKRRNSQEYISKSPTKKL